MQDLPKIQGPEIVLKPLILDRTLLRLPNKPSSLLHRLQSATLYRHRLTYNKSRLSEQKPVRFKHIHYSSNIWRKQDHTSTTITSVQDIGRPRHAKMVL